MKVSTKLDKTATEQTTELSINWDGMTPEDIKALAQGALIVKLQGGWRRAKVIPATAAINAVDHKVGTRAPKVSPLEALKAMDKDALRAFLTANGISLD